jgi:hypothetical protein
LDYPVPEYSHSPTNVFSTPEELIVHCCTHKDSVQRVYWLNRSESDPHSAHVYFIPDNGLILGLSVATQDEADWDLWLNKLRSFAGSKYGYIRGECPPKETVAEFIAEANKVI